MKKFLAGFSLMDLIIIALMAALGIALKPVISPLVRIISGPLFIPGGALAGGLYMFPIALAAAITGRRGAATLTAFVQAIIVIVTAVPGSHGVWSLVTYVAPGLAADLVLLLMRHNGCCVICCLFAGIASNLAGTLAVNYTFFNLPFIPLMLTLVAGALSGALGGAIAWNIARLVRRLGFFSERFAEDEVEDDFEEDHQGEYGNECRE